jgi:hypothetical protein
MKNVILRKNKTGKIIFTKEQSKNIIKLYNCGKSSTFIGNKYGINFKVIIRFLRANNISIRKQIIKLTDEQHNLILEEYNEGLSAKQVSTKLNLSYQYVGIFIRKNVKVLRPSSDYSRIFDEKTIKLIVKDYYLGLSYKLIAEKYNCEISIIKRTIKKNIITNNFIICKECLEEKHINLHTDKNNMICLICNNCRDKISKIKKKVAGKKRYQKHRSSPRSLLSKTISSYISNCLKKRGIKKNVKTIFDGLDYGRNDVEAHFEKLFSSPENLTPDGKVWMTSKNYGKYDPKTWKDDDISTWKWQIDHIIPQSTFKYNLIEDDGFKKCWALDNLRPYSAKQNYYDGVRRTRH